MGTRDTRELGEDACNGGNWELTNKIPHWPPLAQYGRAVDASLR